MMTSTEIQRWLPWALLIAALAHITDEFVLPGGFVRWYRSYRGAKTASVTPRFLFLMNAAMLAGCACAAQPGSLWLWMGMAGILASNGLWHLYATLRSRTYSPGVITGTLLYIPLAAFGLVYFLRAHAISPIVALVALLVGATYPHWSDWYHKRGGARTAEIPVR